MISANVKTYMDGDRFILVVERANNGETAKIIREFVAKLLIDAPAAEIKGLEPHPDPLLDETPFVAEGCENMLPEAPVSVQEAREYVLTSGEYKGLTFDQAIKKYGRRAAVKFYTFGGFPQEISAALKRESRNAILYDLDKRDPAIDARKDVQEFIIAYRPLIEGTLKSMKDDVGCSSIEDFIKYSDDATLRDAYKTLITILKDRV